MSFAARWYVGVVIPAQNEEATIQKCIASVLAAHEHCGRRAPLWIVVVADACSDDTVTRARAVLGMRGEVIEGSARSPGSARRLGANAVLDHFGQARAARIWLANTDADTHVPLDWLKVHLDHADEGADGVAGIVQLDLADHPREDVIRLYHETYELARDGTHSHVHGANLGVRGDAYLDVGGWSPLTVAEDHCLWRRLKIRGWRLRSCVRSVVLSSARLHGRAIGGFADTLRHRLETGHG
jgi:cellulose synthase/poly-beta-1,6-N-acetylglucosamine synthase-like glycosyltransferase